MFSVVDLKFEFFEWSPQCITRRHEYKLYKISASVRVRSTFFSERVINASNELHPKTELILSLLFILGTPHCTCSERIHVNY